MEEIRKAMLSQPMAGKSEEQITEQRDHAIKELEARGYKVINTRFTDEWYSPENMAARGVVNKPMTFMSKSLEHMALCHAVYFCAGWEKARGCKVEHQAAIAYGMEIIYEDENAAMKDMDAFLMIARRRIATYCNEHPCHPEYANPTINANNVFIVWASKTLQNKKACFGNDIPNDDRFFEVTYSGNRGEMYIDVYRKEMNTCRCLPSRINING